MRRHLSGTVGPGGATRQDRLGGEEQVGRPRPPPPPTVTAAGLGGPYDLILLSCKAFDLDNAIDSFAPAVGPDTAILPLLNGTSHLDSLVARFGESAVLGGQSAISLVLDPEGRVLHLNEGGTISFGERFGSRTPRVEAIAEAFAAAGVHGGATETIVQGMWGKWVFIATAAGITCLMRAAVRDIVTAGAADRTLDLFDVISSIAASRGARRGLLPGSADGSCLRPRARRLPRRCCAILKPAGRSKRMTCWATC